MSDLYDSDVLLWCERQSGLLRRVAAGDPSNGGSIAARPSPERRPDFHAGKGTPPGFTVTPERAAAGAGNRERSLSTFLVDAVLHLAYLRFT